VPDGYNVVSEKGKSLCRPYKTKKDAEKRLEQVEYFKRNSAKGAQGLAFAGLCFRYSRSRPILIVGSTGGKMRPLAISSALILLLAAISLRGFAARPRQQQNNTPMSFTGELTDNVCAAQSSHDAMIQKEGFKNSKDCTLGCVKSGGQFVLYAPANKTTYQLDDQEKPSDYAGQKVTIIGTYDGATKTIHVQSIQSAP
jgi:hypothetical protein